MANDSDSDDSSTTVRKSDRVRWHNVALHDRLSTSDMTHLKSVFDAASNNKMTATEFRDLLRTMFQIEYDDEEFNILFLKINSSRTGEINWDELVSHLILCYFGNDPENQRGSLQLPILGRPKILNSKHKHRISRICFCPEVTKDRSIDPTQGSYITASHDGLINWWTLDMKLKRSACSSSLHLKVHSTWVTDMVCMPDVNIIVISSTERDLRFYDCTANNFALKIVITSWEYMICSMSYYFHQEDKEQCKLICGDVGGNLRLLLFSANMRGPFRGDTLLNPKMLRHVDLQKTPHLLPGLRLEELAQVHAGWVRQVGYYASLHCVLSCATGPDPLFMCDTRGAMDCKMFRVEKGIRCFAFDEEAHVLVTGGPDRVVRVWNPFVPTKPNLTFHGHQACVIWIVLQNQGQTIYSLSRNRTIKVWDVQSQTCRQTYNDIPTVLEKTPITAVYNPVTRQFILAAYKIVVLLLDEQLNLLHTDGFTHSTRVSKVLYNPLFKVIITCGMDSIVINWNPVSGKRNLMIREAHTCVLHGQMIPVEITAACFDPGHLLLLTGARNGELKVWNFNTGSCMRVMSIEHMCEVTNCFWVEGRILAVGWNRRVVEFEDCCMSTTGKNWETRHTDDVLAAAVRPSLTLATATYNSELVMWRLETGQPYRRFSCAEPTAFFKENYVFAGVDPGATTSCKRGGRRGLFASCTIRKPNTAAAHNVLDSEAAIRKAAMRCVSSKAVCMLMPSGEQAVHHLAAQAMIFLHTRPQHTSVASLFLALDSGHVQCWSDHAAGGFLGSFHAIHCADDYVTSFASDADNEFLFTGTVKGYVKVWLMTNFLDNHQIHISMPRLRLMFPFLWRDRIEGRAKRTVRDQPLPMLLNSYRAHMRSVTTIAYIDELKLVLTGSADYSARVWRLSGQYLQTLGSFVPWTLDATRFPPDVKKVASSTTLKVWRGGEVSRYVPRQKESDKLRDVTEDELQHKTFGTRLAEPLLGKHRSLPPRPYPQDSIKLNVSLPKISLYKHLRLAATVPVRRPPTPEVLRKKQLREKPKKMHFDESALQMHRAQSTYSRQSEPSGQARQSTYSNYSTYSRQSTQIRSSMYSSQSRPSAYSSQSRPSAYSSQSRPSAYSSQSRPSAYSSQSRPSAYSSQSRPSAYSSQYRPSAYSSQSRPSAYSSQSRPSAYSSQSRPSAYSSQSRPSTYFRLSTYSRQSRRSTYSPRFRQNSTLDEEDT